MSVISSEAEARFVTGKPEELLSLNERSWLARFGENEAAVNWAEAVRSQALWGTQEVVVAYCSVAVIASHEVQDLARYEAELRAVQAMGSRSGDPRVFHLPVLYDGEDLESVADWAGVSIEEIVGLHAGQDYRVFAIGFLPGFPYAGYLPSGLEGLPRRTTPRLRVAAGSVAIAGRQTGVYPRESPGGWHLLGRTPLRIVDVPRGVFPIKAGDSVRFEPIDANRCAELEGLGLWEYKGWI